MRLPLVLLLLCVVSGCQNGPAEPNVPALRETPTSTMFGGQLFELEVHLYRDFMPVAPPNGQPLAAVVRLPDRLATARVERIWVLFGDEVWSADLEQVPGTQDWVARNGPLWAPGARVDVVARLRDAAGNEVLVRAPNRVIERTD